MPDDTTTDDGTGQGPPSGQDTTDDPWASPEAARSEIEKLRRESASWRTKVRELEPLAKQAADQVEANKSEVQKALDRATEAERVAQVAQLDSARLRAASAHGLSETQANRLTGTTPEELEADAKAFAAELGITANGRKSADLKQGPRGPAAAADPDAWLRKMVNRQ